MLKTNQDKMHDFLRTVPSEIRADFRQVFNNAGVLNAASCARICHKFNLSVEDLMVRLLPLAAIYSRAPISSYPVGAIARGIDSETLGYPSLYVGANFEFKDQPLNHSVHAEQSAIANAWLNNEPMVNSLATSSAPCGHCRQFLYEVAGSNSMSVLISNASSEDFSWNEQVSTLSNSSEQKSVTGAFQGYVSFELIKLLPSAFGGADLGSNRLLMELANDSSRLVFARPSADSVVNAALGAANQSFAPYTGNLAGCAIEMMNGEVYLGRYAENAAYNPSLPAFSMALSQLAIRRPKFSSDEIKRVVLVECPTKTNQKASAQHLLHTYNEKITFEYHKAIVKRN